MSQVGLRLVYEGDSLEGGELDVRLLAPALAGIGDLCARANQIVNGDDVKASVRVKSEFVPGSFGIDLVLELAGASSLIGLDARGIMTILGFLKDATSVARGLLGLFKELGQKQDQMSFVEVDEEIEVRMPDGRSVRVHRNVRNMYTDGECMRSLGQILVPLATTGVSVLSSMDDHSVVERIDADDYQRVVSSPTQPKEALPRSDSHEAISLVEVVQPVLSGDYKWRVSDGSGARITAKMADLDFISRVEDRSVVFGSGDFLRVRMRIDQAIDDSGKLHVSRTIEQVLDHFPSRKLV